MAITMCYDLRKNDAHRSVIDTVIEDKRSKRPWDLVEETHASGKAWSLIYDNGAGNYLTISQELIRTKG